MMKHEFISKVQEINGGVEPDLKSVDWPIIECVYTYHPSIGNIKGKEQIAELYVNYGMRVIKDMVSTAMKCKELEEKLLSKRDELDELYKEFELART